MWKADLDSKVLLPNGKPIPAVLLANKVRTVHTCITTVVHCMYIIFYCYDIIFDVL